MPQNFNEKQWRHEPDKLNFICIFVLSYFSVIVDCWYSYCIIYSVPMDLGPRGIRMGSGEGFTKRNFIVCTAQLIKSRRLRWAGHVARIEKVGVISKF